MAKFLNTQGLSEWIPKIIDETESELVILTPYIQLSQLIYNKLLEANKRGVETLLIYRENKLTDEQKEKLKAIDNLNLMHHPNLHAKCFYNENYLLIASMNLYDYSVRNNREMGVLLHRDDIELTPEIEYGDDDNIFEDAIKEIKLIINSAEMERESRETLQEGFDMEIIKTNKELTQEYCNNLNKYFGHKRFEVIQERGDYLAKCFNFFDRIDVTIDYRVQIDFNQDNRVLDKWHSQFDKLYSEFMYEGFKFYWNSHSKQVAHLYPDRNHALWSTEQEDSYRYPIISAAIKEFYSTLRTFQ